MRTPAVSGSAVVWLSEIPPLRESFAAITCATGCTSTCTRNAKIIRNREAEVAKLADAPDLGLSFCLFCGVALRSVNGLGSKYPCGFQRETASFERQARKRLKVAQSVAHFPPAPARVPVPLGLRLFRFDFGELVQRIGSLAVANDSCATDSVLLRKRGCGVRASYFYRDDRFAIPAFPSVLSDDFPHMNTAPARLVRRVSVTLQPTSRLSFSSVVRRLLRPVVSPPAQDALLIRREVAPCLCGGVAVNLSAARHGSRSSSRSRIAPGSLACFRVHAVPAIRRRHRPCTPQTRRRSQLRADAPRRRD